MLPAFCSDLNGRLQVCGFRGVVCLNAVSPHTVGDDEQGEVFTIGHSTMSYEAFLELLRIASVDAIADVRSAPFSRHFPHFNRDTLKRRLADDGVAYVFLGKELGGRPRDSNLFHNGVADYELMAATESFKAGLCRVLDGAKQFRIALMCSERSPLDCHRCLLVGRALREQGANVRHILGNGNIEPHEHIEEALLNMAEKDHADFFMTPQARLLEAYRERSMKVAFAEAVENAEPSRREGDFLD